MGKPNISTFLVSVLSAALLASCSKDTGTEPSRGREDVVFTVMPQIVAGYENIPSTYSSDKVRTDNVSATDYRQRYILEAWSEDGNTKQYREVKITEIGGDAPVFSPRLLSAKYKMAVWADFVTAASVTAGTPAGSTDLFYQTDNLTDITVLKADFSNDAKDAYAAAFDADLTGSGLSLAVTLRRPLAKIRLVALDADKANSNAGLDDCTASLVYSNCANRSYNALDGNVTDSGSASGSSDYFSVGNDYGSAYGPSPATDNHSQTLAWDYVFVPAGGMQTDLTIQLKNGSQSNITLPSASDGSATSKPIKGVTLKPNTLTTAVGYFFTPVETVTPEGGN